MSLHTFVEHVVSPVGKVSVPLYGFAAKLFEKLESREIPRLKRLRQLGVLDRLHSGAHHTRWDYVMLQLYLLRVFSQHTIGLGLNTNFRISNNLKSISGLEAIQGYMLLRDFGHLNGTFEMERLVLEICAESSPIRAKFLRGIPKPFKPWASDIIDRERVRNFYQLLSVLLLANGSEFRGDTELRAASMDLLQSFFVGNESRIGRLKEIHRRVRTLAYLALDTHYAPVGVSIDLNPILVNPQEYAPKLLVAPRTDFRNMTFELQEYLDNSLYSSPDATWAFLDFRRIHYRRLHSNLDRIQRQDTLIERLENYKQDLPTARRAKVEQRPIYTIVQTEGFRFEPSQEGPISSTRKWAKALNVSKNQLAIVSPHALSGTRAYVYHPQDLVKKEGELSSRFNRILKTVSEAEVGFRNRYPANHALRPSAFFLESLESVFRSILMLATGDEYRVAIETEGVPLGLHCLCRRTKPKLLEALDSLLSDSGLKALDSSRKAELRFVRRVCDSIYGGMVAACLGRTTLSTKPKFLPPATGKTNYREVAEFDGLIMVANRRHTKLYVLECKNAGRGNVGQARKQLDTRLPEVLVPEWQKLVDNCVEIDHEGVAISIRLP